MRVLILGFSSLQEIDSVMEKLIENTQCFLFTVVCGGTDNVAYGWAQKVGAPVTFSQAKTPQALLKEICIQHQNHMKLFGNVFAAIVGTKQV